MVLLSKRVTIVLLISLFLFIVALLLTGQLLNTFKIDYSVEILNVSGSTFQYNLWGSLSKLWSEELYFLYFFLFLWSGIGPFAKLGLLFLTVVYPLNKITRWKCFHRLGHLGVWSFADIWVVVMICIVLDLDETIDFDGAEVTAHLQVTALSGAGVLFFGLFLSQVVNIVAIQWTNPFPTPSLGYYRVVVSNEAEEEEDNSDDEVMHIESLVCHKVSSSSVLKWFVRVAYLSILLFVFIGMFTMPIYEIKYVVMKNHISVERYSIAEGLLRLRVSNDFVGKYLLLSTSVVLVIMLPLILHLIVFRLLAAPITMKKLASVDRLLEVVTHFSSLEVFLVSSIFVSYELGSLLTHLALGKYLSIEINILPQLFVYLTGLVILGAVKYMVCSTYHDKLYSSTDPHDESEESYQPLISRFASGSSIVL